MEKPIFKPVLTAVLNSVDAVALTTMAVSQSENHPMLAVVIGAYAALNLGTVGWVTQRLSQQNTQLTSDNETLTKQANRGSITPYTGPMRKKGPEKK